jgi:hypothetical protein
MLEGRDGAPLRLLEQGTRHSLVDQGEDDQPADLLRLRHHPAGQALVPDPAEAPHRPLHLELRHGGLRDGGGRIAGTIGEHEDRSARAVCGVRHAPDRRIPSAG